MSPGHTWTFLTNHAHVLLCLARNPDLRFSDMATAVGITYRAAQRIVADLLEAGYLTREKVGRRNHYQIHGDRPLRHPMEREHVVGELLEMLAQSRGSPAADPNLGDLPRDFSPGVPAAMTPPAGEGKRQPA